MGHSMSSNVDFEQVSNIVRFYFYSDPRNLTKCTEIIHGDVESIRRTTYNTFHPLTLLVHGFNTSFEGSFLQDTKNALLRQSIQTNVIMVDYREFSRVGLHNFPDAFPYVPGISQRITDFLVFLINYGIVSSPESIHLIGESLGAHISGLVGKSMEKLKGQKIQRITGLDPGGPIFQDESEDVRLCPSDASFVDVVHSNEGVFGYTGSIGHVDFYLNDTNDPGWMNMDKNDLSHAFAVELYTESILKKVYYGCGCYRGKRTCEEFEIKVETCDKYALFGYFIPRSTRGEYYVKAYNDKVKK